MNFHSKHTMKPKNNPKLLFFQKEKDHAIH
jgi:hypothetical protein